MIERFNGRIEKALKERKAFLGNFKTKQELFDFILTSTDRYNSTRLQCLHSRTPLEMLDAIVSKASVVSKDDAVAKDDVAAGDDVVAGNGKRDHNDNQGGLNIMGEGREGDGHFSKGSSVV
jgi:hypothetical protein